VEPPLAERMAKRLLFQGLSPTQLETIAEMTRVREVDSGEVIVHERDYGDTLHVIESGAVEVYVASPNGDRLVARLSAPEEGEISYAGDFFGEMCLLDLEPRCATVKAEGPCRLWELNRDDLYWLFGDDKELQLRILLTVARVLSRRLGLMDAGAAQASGGG